MFELQASRFAEVEVDEHGEEVVHDTLALTTCRRRSPSLWRTVKLGYRAEPRAARWLAFAHDRRSPRCPTR